MSEAAQLALVIVSGLLVFAGLFRPEVRKKLGDLRAITFPGGSADMTGSEAAAQVEAQKHVPTSEPEKLPIPAPGPSSVPAEMPPPSAVFGPLEADLRQRIEQAIPGALDAQLAWALRFTVMAQVERDHEQTYRFVFGSQIAALKELNVRGALTLEQAREVYALTAMKNYPETFKDDTFDDWGMFLVNRGLVVIAPQPPTAETRAILTHLGRDFLMFVTGRGLTEYKWG